MAGGTGKYNRRLIADLSDTPGLGQDPTSESVGLAGAAEGRSGPADTAGSGLPANRRHCWALGPAEDPGPHPALLTGTWVRQDATWYAKVTWYSEIEDAVVQQWLPATSLRPVL